MSLAPSGRRFAVLARAGAALALVACSVEKAPRAAPAADPPAVHAPAVARAVAAAERPDTARPRRPDSVKPAAITAPGRTTPPTHAPAGPRRVAIAGVDFTGIGYDRGSTAAPVVMIDLSDFACPYCGEFSRETYPAIEREYVQTGKLFFKYVPFVVGSFVHSREATRATECAADQDGFWPMLAKVYGAQKEWKSSGNPYAVLSAAAGAAGLDTVRLGECYRSQRTDARTARVTERANALGVRVTPSFLVDGRPVQGALPLEEFRKVIDAALLLSQSRR